MPVNVSLVEIKLESPTLLVDRVGRTGYSSIYGWIPGSTLRGSIVTWTVRSGYAGEETYSSEMNDPKLVVHPAYPVEGVTARPPTPFIQRCKMEDEVVDALGREAVSELTLAHDMGEVARLIDRSSNLCSSSRGIPNATKAERKPVIFDGRIRKYYPPSGDTDVLTSVSINKYLRSAETGMLFNYEVLLPGQRFRTVVVDRTGDGIFSEYLKREGLLYLGRGTSRGLGRVEARILRTWELKPLIQELKGKLEEWVVDVGSRVRVTVYARSPACRMMGWGISSFLPSLDPDWLGVGADLGLAVDRNGRPMAIGRRTRFLSVSYPTGIPRPSLACSDRGSIFVLESEGSEDDVGMVLAIGSILGWDGLAVLGLNILQPLGWWYDDPIYS